MRRVDAARQILRLATVVATGTGLRWAVRRWMNAQRWDG